MRDYKNVNVPKKYRTASKRATTVRRVETRRMTRRPEVNFGRVKQLILKAVVAAVIIAGCWLGWLAYQTTMHADVFEISGVDVKGVKQLDVADLKKIVGAFTGVNIFKADLDAAVKRAHANPWVKTITINRRLPNRISMVITERTPYAMLETATGRSLLDNEGVLISRLTKENAALWRLPTLFIRDHKARPGEQAASEGLSEALKLLSEIASRGGWRLEDVAIKADTPESLTLVYANHEFKLGSGRYPEKLRRLAEVMEDVKRRDLNVAYVDLRPDRQVAVMVKNAGNKVRK